MPNPRRSNTRIPLAALFAAWLCTAALPLSAATITVDSVETNDVDDGICTLREAILAANQDIAYHGCSGGSGIDQIGFDLPPASTILGTSVPLPAVTDSVRIVGPGAEELTIDGAGLQPIFLVDSAAAPISVWLSDLTLAHGHATGAGAGGAVTVLAGDSGIFQRVVFRDNDSTEAGGGAIRAVGTLAAPAGATVDDCFFESNDGGDGGGGAIHLDHAIAQVRRSTFAFNETETEPGAGSRAGAAPSAPTTPRSRSGPRPSWATTPSAPGARSSFSRPIRRLRICSGSATPRWSRTSATATATTSATSAASRSRRFPVIP